MKFLQNVLKLTRVFLKHNIKFSEILNMSSRNKWRYQRRSLPAVETFMSLNKKNVKSKKLYSILLKYKSACMKGLVNGSSDSHSDFKFESKDLESKNYLNNYFNCANDVLSKEKIVNSAYDYNKSDEDCIVNKETMDPTLVKDHMMDLHLGSAEGLTAENDFGELIREMKENLTDENFSFLEKLMFFKPDPAAMIDKLVSTFPKENFYTVCDQFCSLSSIIISKYSKIFCTSVMLPVSMNATYDKRWENTFFQCLRHFGPDALKYILIPLMLSSNPVPVICVGLVSKLAASQKHLLLRGYLNNANASNIRDWMFPVILILFNAVEGHESLNMLHLMTTFLMSGSKNFSQSIGFAKIIYAVLQKIQLRADEITVHSEIHSGIKIVIEQNESKLKKSLDTKLYSLKIDDNFYSK